MRKLLIDIIEAFKYEGVPCSKDHCNLIEGNWVFQSTFAGDNFIIDAKFYDGQTTSISVFFAANWKESPRDFEDNTIRLVKMMIKDGFDDWRREQERLKTEPLMCEKLKTKK
jgi:hypothetical protein